MQLLTERYHKKIQGIISCYDRIVIHGTLPGFNYAQGMTSFLKSRNIRIFDYPRFAQTHRDDIRTNTEAIAKDHGIEIQFIQKTHIRKDDIVKNIIKERGSHPGLVAILSAMESCQAYKPWHNKKTHQTYLRYTQGKCLHYYFYFIDKTLGLCYLRVPTWCPFRLQFYYNGHSWLASKLTKHGIGYSLIDNGFVFIEDFDTAQELADGFRVKTLHHIIDSYAKLFCPVYEQFNLSYHWSIMQTEYATDIVFKKQSDLEAIYNNLVRTAIHTVKPENIATFLGRKLHDLYQGDMGNNFNIRIEGSRIKHHMGSAAIKMYDKHGLILRIETTTNDISFFKHYREVEQRDGSITRKYAHMRKNIYSLYDLQKLLCNANHRYLEFISSIEDRTAGIKRLKKASQSVEAKGHSYKGFNFFNEEDMEILQTIARGEFNINGFQNKNLRKHLVQKTSSQVSRILKRLHLHGLIKKIRDTYKYYPTKLGRIVIATGLKLKEFFIIPQLCY